MRELYDPVPIAAALRDARDYTRSVYAHLDLASVSFPYVRTVNPPLWELAHVAWFQEHWCLRWRDGALREPSLMANADPILNSALIAHADRWNLPQLTWPLVRDYMSRVLDATLARLEREPAGDKYFYLLSLYHEDMHAEAFRMSLQTLGLPGPSERAIAMPPAAVIDTEEVVFEGGTLELGSRPGPDFVFDNEQWAHEVVIAPFALATRAVTQGDYRAFVESSGYTQRNLWPDAGWQWRERSGLTHPRHWVRAGGDWRVRRFDVSEALDDSIAMMHVSAYEAEAYAAFAGRRLPSEAEWEYAARAGRSDGADRYPWGGSAMADPAAVNLDNRYGRPVASAALAAADSAGGLRQMLGNVWEWTSSAFLPYPGFTPGPYREYSQPWFGDHRVLRGGSFATRSRLVHNRWRNFYTPDRSDVFAGIRLARSLR